MSTRERAAGAIAAVVVLLVVVGASARRPLDGGAPVPALPTWPLLVVAGAGMVMAAALAASILRARTRMRSALPEGERRRAIRAGRLTRALAVLVPLTIISVYASLLSSGRHT